MHPSDLKKPSNRKSNIYSNIFKIQPRRPKNINPMNIKNKIPISSILYSFILQL